MAYPSRILPRSTYQSNIDLDTLIEEVDLYIIRRSDKSQDKTFDKFGNLREDAIEIKEFFGLSLNILGGEFLEEDSCFKAKNDGASPWDGQSDVDMEKFEDCYEQVQDFNLIYLHAAELHNLEIPYNQSKDSPSAVELGKMYGVQAVNSQYSFTGKSKLEHDPINLNYWHVVHNVYDIENKIIPRKENLVNKSASKYSFNNAFVNNASSSINGYQSIDVEYYIKKPQV